MVGESSTSNIIIVAVAAAAAFLVMGLTFYMYDRFVRMRNNKIVYAAARSNAIISSLFPKLVMDRLFAERDEKNARKDQKEQKTDFHSVMGSNMKELKDDRKDSDCKERPLADLYPETTILFADIVGFTAWSSVREPCQVFVLLETFFQAFDDIARKRRVYKVETVGDCYVAVVGLPEPRPDHAMVMARFARDCMVKMQSLAKKLELTLGPDTGELSMRMGIHSGPVTAGVLRGERSRFQLFGDTMNTAARMEQTGCRGQIHVSEYTATLLMKAGKTSWVTARDDGKKSFIHFHSSISF
jgi:class 3 adenylate cyclase